MAISEIILNAIFTGIGVTIGTYLANRHLIKNIEKLEELLRKRRK